MRRGITIESLRFWRRAKTPVLTQIEAAECGLTCLAMIAQHHGIACTISQLRERHSGANRGMTLSDMVGRAQTIGLTARALQPALEQLCALRLPCILHWNMSHFVVLVQVKRNGIVIHDPAVGRRSIPMPEVSRAYTGVAMTLTPRLDHPVAARPRPVSWRRFIGKITGLKRAFLLTACLALVLQLCTIIVPFFMQWIVDDALLTNDRELVHILSVVLLVFVLVQMNAGAMRAWVATTIAAEINFQWLTNTFEHLLRLPGTYFENRHLGDIVSRFESIQVIQRTFTLNFVETLIDGVMSCLVLVVMFAYSPGLAAVSLIAAALYVLVNATTLRRMQETVSERILHESRQHTSLIESIRGAEAIKLFNAQAPRLAMWSNQLARQFNCELDTARLSVVRASLNTAIFGVERIAVLWWGALLLIDGAMTTGMLLAYLSFRELFSHRSASLIDKSFEIKMLRLHAQRIGDIAHHREEHTGPVAPHLVNRADCQWVSGDREAHNHARTGDEHHTQTPALITFDRVSFGYGTDSPPIIHPLTLEIRPLECIAITGPSGSGKTTFAKLFLGLLLPTSGEILIDGVALPHYGIARHRQLVGSVMQNDVLFAGTIAENICFFTTPKNWKAIVACATKAAVHNDIVAMPMGYNTLVGDLGAGLSGGQIQRIVLARALYKSPSILVLDEATSHLDTDCEILVNRAIGALTHTRIVIAHRPQTINMADRVIRIESGRVVADEPTHTRHSSP